MYRSLAATLLVIMLVACGAEQPALSPLGVVTVQPENGAVDVTPGTTVSASFDRAIDASTLASRFTLSRDGEAVDGTVRFVRATRIALFTPDEVLAEGTYLANLASGIRADDGSVLPSGQVWSFSVSAGEEPGDPPGEPVAPDPSDPSDPSDPPDPLDPDDPVDDRTGLRAAFLSPTPNKRLAGVVNVEVDLEALQGIERAELFVDGEGDAGSVRVGLLVTDLDAAPVVRDQLSASISTVDFETGIYGLRIRLEDRAGDVIEEMLLVEFLTPFMITHPTEGEGVGLGTDRQIVAVTIGVNGTILDDYDVTSIDLYINGALYATDIPVDADPTSTRLIVYPWDTTDPGLGGHPVDAPGDRVLTARVYFEDPATSTARNEFTPGVIVDYQP